MPSCRRKHVVPLDPSPALLETVNHDANKEVYLLVQTGEIFDNYDAYAARMSYYKTKHFQCDVTGRSGLDYFQALESEQNEARTLHSRFPEQLKAAVLRSVQFRVMGRLDHLVDEVHERFNDRYFEGENIFVEFEGHKYAARIEKVRIQPDIRMLMLQKREVGSDDESIEYYSDSDLSAIDNDTGVPLHIVGGDLRISQEESVTLDNPRFYSYTVEILKEQESEPEAEVEIVESPSGTRRESDRVKARREHGVPGAIHIDDLYKVNDSDWAGTKINVDCDQIMRDRLVFSKSLLRRFLRECLDRDSSLASPWMVKPALAKRYNIPTEIPENLKEENEKVRKDEIDKRKKVWEEKEAQAAREGRLTKKMIKEREREAKAAAKAADAAAKAEEEKSKAERLAADKMAKELAERLADEDKAKKKAIRYPTEDLNVFLTDRDKKAGMKLTKPTPKRSPDDTPFNDSKGGFENFIAVWNFLICFGQPLHLSFFTLDDFEQCLRHTSSDLTCVLLAEIHSVLLYNLRTVPFNRHAAVLSLLELKQAQMDIDNENPSIDRLTEVLADVGNNWERVPLKPSEEREGWQDALIGCLKDHATTTTLPGLRSIFQRLLFDEPEDRTGPTDSSPLSSPTQSHGAAVSQPSERYYALSPTERLAILKFMCDLATTSKAIHTHLEWCEEQLTVLRKERIEVNRQKRQLQEEMTALLKEGEDDEKKNEEDKKGEESDNATNPNEASDVESDNTPGSEDASDGGSSLGRRANSTQRQQALRIKAQQQQAMAKQRELERQKLANQRQALSEHRRLDEEVGKLDRRLEGIDREFRKVQGVIRLKPLGKDRFHNRVWWFDGCGTSALIGNGGNVQYATGRLFIQGPSSIDKDAMDRKAENDVQVRRVEEEGEGRLDVDEWAVYTDVEEIDEFVAWLNPKGIRELALKNTMTKWWDVLAPGVRRRAAQMGQSLNTKVTDTRRSHRGRNSGSDITKEPYMQWTNRQAVNL